MKEQVIDSSVILKWLREEGEADVEEARALERQYRRGELQVTVPPLLFLELLNTAGRRWGWPPGQLGDMVGWLLAAGFRVHDPDLRRIAHWTGEGLTAYDACYVALAEERRTVVVTADERILAVAGALAEPLAPAERSLGFVQASANPAFSEPLPEDELAAWGQTEE